MPIVNYVREHIRFMEYASDEHLSSSERLLWYALMHIMNQRAQGNIWPDEFIRISNDRLLSFCPMKFDTLATARNNLKQRGLIDYLKGEKNKKSPAYRMIYFYPQYVQPETERDGMQSNSEKPDCAFGKAGIERDNPQSNTEKSYYMGGNMGDNIGYKPGDNPGGNMGDIYNKHILIQKGIPEQKTDSTTEEEEELARAREETKDAWIRYFGKEPTPGIIDLLSMKSCGCEFGDGIIEHAISLACYRDAASPTDFILTLFQDWRKNGIRNMDDLEEYGFLHDAYTNKIPEIMNFEEARDKLKEFRAKRGVR